MQNSDWIIAYDKPEAGKSSEHSFEQESLMTLGNGYLKWRGAPVWSQLSDGHFPGLYAAGVFNGESNLVNLPNPQLMRFTVNGTLVKFDDASIVDRRSFIDLARGCQSDRYTVRTNDGFVILTSTKYTDPLNFHAIGFEGTFSATFDGDLLIESLIDGADSREFHGAKVSDHLLQAKVDGTDAEIVIAAKTFVNGSLIEQVDNSADGNQLIERTQLHFTANEAVNFEKVIEVASSCEVENPAEVARRDVESLPLASIKENNADYWAKVWKEADVKLDIESSEESGETELQRKIRLSVFHLRCSAQHSANQFLNASLILPELSSDSGNSVLPYYIANTPETARDILTDLLRHTDNASLTTACNLSLYEQFTGDLSLLKDGGLEFLLECLKFWVNKAELADDDSEELKRLLNYFFTLPKTLSGVSGLNLREAARETGFDDKVFHKARELSEKLYLGSNRENENEKVLRRLVEKFDNTDVSLSEMASLLEVIQNGFAGVSLSDGVMTLAPNLPGSWHNLVFNQKIRGVRLNIEITERLLILTADQDLTVMVYGTKANLKAGILSTFALKK